MALRLLKWFLGIPLGIAAYLYDDALWGPIPIGFMNHYFGWPFGFALLSLVYFIVSYIASFFILKHYRQKKANLHNKKRTSEKMNKKRSFAYRSLAAGKWIGLIVSCFMLGAILTSVFVGKLKLFKNVDESFLSLIMSSAFVVLFMGLYGGIYSIIISYGFFVAIFMLFIIALFIKLWLHHSKQRYLSGKPV